MFATKMKESINLETLAVGYVLYKFLRQYSVEEHEWPFTYSPTVCINEVVFDS